MKILAVDTSAKTASAAITDGTHLIASATLNAPGTHSVTLLPMIDALFSASSMKPEDIDMFACSAGPGSFTGVRIGVSLIKGFGFGTDKPCVGVSALEALAYNMSMAEGILCPVMDARRSQLYNALFRCEGGVIQRLTEDRLLTVEQLAAELSGFSANGERIYFNGEGTDIALRGIALPNAYTAPGHCLWQSGYSVAVTALKIYEDAAKQGETRDMFTCSRLSPVYLRASQAEREREERLSHQDNR